MEKPVTVTLGNWLFPTDRRKPDRWNDRFFATLDQPSRLSVEAGGLGLLLCPGSETVSAETARVAGAGFGNPRGNRVESARFYDP